MKTCLPVICVLLLTLTACSSKKPTQSSTPDQATVDELMLNGSSDDNKAGGLRTVHFAYNADQLDTSAKETLKANADYLAQNKNIAIQIEGHCDERGGRQYNLALGERRSKAIKEYLRALGIKAFRMKTFSWGNEKPLDESGTDQGMARNRRGTFVVIAL